MGKNVHLASINDTYEQSFIRYYISQKAPNETFLNGLQSKGVSDTNDTQLFQWTDSWPVFYSHWMSGEPKIPFTSEDQCVTIFNTTNSSSGSWKTVDCKTPFPYICKVSSDTVPDINDNSTNGVCPKLIGNTDKSLEWANLHKSLQHCYWFSTEYGIVGSTGLQSWSDASFQCRGRNGTLVTIHSFMESEIILDRIKHNIYFTSTWIGLSKDQNMFVWEDGSPLFYTNWSDGERFKNTTDLNDNTKSCVEMSLDMTWKQVDCYRKRDYFVCQTKKLSSSSSLREI